MWVVPEALQMGPDSCTPKLVEASTPLVEESKFNFNLSSTWGRDVIDESLTWLDSRIGAFHICQQN